jgi:hypothetical protein
MASNPLFYQLLLVALVLICLMVHVGLPDDIPRVTKTPLGGCPRKTRPALSAIVAVGEA